MNTGIGFGRLSAGLFGANTPLARQILGAVDPWMMAGLLDLGVGVGLAAIHLFRALLRLPAVEAPLRRTDMPWLALVILFEDIRRRIEASGMPAAPASPMGPLCAIR
ncbi:hypothetical protein [Xanthobacter autotrophicus]|uniref:hypothetical protein n=1 Tax=Xanthobacter autotrophicus TaxID=280 RepID=UPI00372712D3